MAFSIIVYTLGWVGIYYIFFTGCFLLLRLTSSRKQFKCFMTFGVTTMVVSFLYSKLAHPIFFLIGRHDLAQLTTSYVWWYLTAPVTGLKLHVEGEHTLKSWGGGTATRGRKGPCVFVANHQSELDVFVMGRQHTVACATWRVRSLPLFGPYMRLCRSVFVDPPKSFPRSNVDLLQDAAAMIRREGKNVLIFPEGVRSYVRQAELLPFKRGGIVLAMQAGHVPIMPIVVGNMSHVFDFRNAKYRPGTINVKVMDPVSTTPLDDESEADAIERIVQRLRTSMLDTLKEISEPAWTPNQ